MIGRAVAWFCIALSLALAVTWLAMSGRLQIHSDLLALLPEQFRDPVKAAAMDRLAGSGQRRLTVIIGAPEGANPASAAEAMAQVLAASPYFVSVINNVSDWLEADDAGDADILFQHRFHLLSAADQRYLAALAGEPGASQEAALEHFLDRARMSLYGPGLSAGRFIADPLGLSRARQRDLRHAAGLPNLQIATGGSLLVRSDTKTQYAIIFAESKLDPFAVEVQARQLAVLEQGVEAARDLLPQAEITIAGMLRHAAYATQQARWEVNTIGIGSLLGITLLMLWAFRSVRPLISSALALGGGCLLAIAATALIFGRVHVLTVVFGASMVGVAIDYCLHFYCERWTMPDPSRALRAIFPGISLALITTVLAYGSMAIADFPGLRQMATFAAFGLVGAWLGVVSLLPAAAGSPPRRGSVLRLAQLWWARGLPRMAARKPALVLGTCAALAVLLLPVVYLTLDASDDIRVLHDPPAELLAADRRVADLLGLSAAGRVIVVRGESPQEVLAREQKILDAIRAADRLQFESRSVSDGVATVAEQRRNYTRLRDTLYAPGGPVEELLREAGFTAAAVDRHMQIFRAAEGQVLTLEAWLETPAGARFAPLWLGNVGGSWASMIRIQALENETALKEILQAYPRAEYINRVQHASNLLEDYRVLIIQLLCAAYLVAWAVLTYALSARAATGIVLAPMLASLIASLVFALTGWTWSLFNVMALLLLLGMGADYGIFLARAKSDPGPTMAAVALSAITTMLAFGLLALSTTPALHGFGLTLAIGLALSFLFASLLGGASQYKGEIST